MRLWVGRRKEPILCYAPKNEEKNHLMHKSLKHFYLLKYEQIDSKFSSGMEKYCLIPKNIGVCDWPIISTVIFFTHILHERTVDIYYNKETKERWNLWKGEFKEDTKE